MLKYVAILTVLLSVYIPEKSFSMSFEKNTKAIQPSEVIREMNVVRQKLIRWVNYIERQGLAIFPEADLNEAALATKYRTYIKFSQTIKQIPLVISQKNCDLNLLNPLTNSTISASGKSVCVNLPQVVGSYNPTTFRKEIFSSLAVEYASLVSRYVTNERKLSLSTVNSMRDLIVQTYSEPREIDEHYFDDLEWQKNNMQRLLSSDSLDTDVFEAAIRDLAIEAKNLQLKEMTSVGQSALSSGQRSLLQSSRLRLLNWEQSLCERRGGHGCRFYMNEAYGTDPVTKQSNTTVSVLRFASILQQVRPYEPSLINPNTMLNRLATVQTMKLSCSIILSILEKIISDGRAEVDAFYQVK